MDLPCATCAWTNNHLEDHMLKQLALATMLFCMAACSGTTRFNGSADGTYRIDGQNAKLAYVFIVKEEPWDGKPTFTFIFSEKDATAAQRVGSIVNSKTYGSVLTLTAYKDPKTGDYHVINNAFQHPALKTPGANGTGTVFLKNMSEANNELAGQAYTNPNSTLFNQTIDIDLKFKAPLPK